MGFDQSVTLLATHTLEWPLMMLRTSNAQPLGRHVGLPPLVGQMGHEAG